jgi:alkyl hydroperoxide reductase subunit AhpF
VVGGGGKWDQLSVPGEGEETGEGVEEEFCDELLFSAKRGKRLMGTAER